MLKHLNLYQTMLAARSRFLCNPLVFDRHAGHGAGLWSEKNDSGPSTGQFKGQRGPLSPRQYDLLSNDSPLWLAFKIARDQAEFGEFGTGTVIDPLSGPFSTVGYANLEMFYFAT